MDILEQRNEWYEQFKSGWLSHYESTGSIDWSLYNRPNNKEAIAGDAIDVSSSRILFISSAGGYLPTAQEPFEADDDIGDYSIRAIPSDTPLDQIAYAHTHYDHTARIADAQVLMPLEHLASMVAAGEIGSLTPSMVNFMGYQPDISQLLDETIPAIVALAKAEKADGALLVPAWPICSQSVGLIARALEMEGIATTLTSWNAGRTRVTMPPRATFTKLARGATLGQPGDSDQQLRILRATLALLEQPAPQKPVRLDETLPEEV